MKLCWLDLRMQNSSTEAILEEAIHQRIDAVVASDASALRGVPPTVKRVLFPADGPLPDDLVDIDIIIVNGDPRQRAATNRLAGVEVGRFVDVRDPASLQEACDAASSETWTVLHFRDPTKIPLEIVLAAANTADGSIISTVSDVDEAEIVFGVLEHGSDGVMLAPQEVGDATRLKAAAESLPADLDLVELEVTRISHVGMGERACIDTSTHFREDEGVLVGSFSKGMILCCSETHPLPYMPTRPFRINAGAIHSYSLSVEGRTNYLSELHAGSHVLAVDVRGRTRVVTVGRVKIESRPLLAIDAKAPDGREVNLIVQDDWHVRVLGPGGAVLNVTELKPGGKILGYLPVEDRHVGYPIDEFCIEQ